MAANSPIGAVDKYLLMTQNALSTEDTETNIRRNNIVMNTGATYQQVDTASRALASLSTNTYKDTILVTNISVNEILAG